MRLTTLLVICTAAIAAFAPAASASVTAPPDWDQAGPDPSVTHAWTPAGGCFAFAARPHRFLFGGHATVAGGGVFCARRARSLSVLACTDILAPNDVWSVGGLVDGWSWRPLSCTPAPDRVNAHGSAARDLTTACSSAYLWWPGAPTVRTELVAQVTNARGQSFQTVDYSRPVTIALPACSSGGSGGGGPV